MKLMPCFLILVSTIAQAGEIYLAKEVVNPNTGLVQTHLLKGPLASSDTCARELHSAETTSKKTYIGVSMVSPDQTVRQFFVEEIANGDSCAERLSSKYPLKGFYCGSLNSLFCTTVGGELTGTALNTLSVEMTSSINDLTKTEIIKIKSK